MKTSKRLKNEKQFDAWRETPSGGRLYWLDISGRMGWRARYVKEVDPFENTINFRQEIYDEHNVLREIPN
ncbi:MAG: hypothetical protein JNL02_04640 [Saprospiraceae bacterium]|nr:hypothetical protein [Saprospiraceae bacterium]